MINLPKFVYTKRGRAILSGILSVALIGGATGTYVVGLKTGQRTALAASYQSNMVEEMSQDTAAALTEGVVNNVLDQTLADYLSKESLDKLLVDSVDNYVKSGAETSDVAATLHDNIYEAVATNAGLLTPEQLAQVRAVATEIADSKLSELNLDGLSEDDVTKLIESMQKEFSKDETVNEILSEEKTPTTSIDLGQVIADSNIPSAVSDLQLKEYSAVQKDAIIKELSTVIEKSVTEQVQTTVASLPASQVTNNATNPATPGITGEQGTQGAPGKDGQDGKDGKDGKDGYIPVKGVDYFTPDEVATIKTEAAKQATDSVKNNLTVLTAQLNSLDKNVKTLTSSVTALDEKVNKALDNKDSEEAIKNATDAITELSKKMSDMSASTADIYNKIDISNVSLRLFKAKGGSIFEAQKVDTKKMSVGDVIGILSQNQESYTSSINKLWYSVQQIQSALGGNLKELDDAIASLSGEYGTTQNGITNLYDEFTALKDDQRKHNEALKGEIDRANETIQKAIEDYNKAIKSGDLSVISKTKEELNKYLKEYDKYLSESNSYVDETLSKSVEDIQKYVQTIISGIEDESITPDKLSEILSKNYEDISQTSADLTAGLSDSIESLKKEIEALKKEFINASTDNKAAEIEQKITETSAMRDHIADTSKTIDQLIKDIQDAVVSGDDATASAKREQLTTVLNNYLSYINQIYDKVDDPTKNWLNSILAQVNNIKNITSDQNISNGELISSIQPSYNDLKEATDGLNDVFSTQLSDLNNHLSGLQSEVLANSEAFNALQQQVKAETEDRITAINEVHTSLEDLYDKISSTNEELSTAISQGNDELVASLSQQLDETLEQLTQEINNNSDTLSNNMTMEIDTLYTHISSVQDAIEESASGNYDALTEAMADLDSTMSDSLTQLDEKTDSLSERIDLLEISIDQRLLDAVDANAELRVSMSGIVDDYNTKLMELKQAVLDDEEGAVATAKAALYETMEELQLQLKENSDILQENLDVQVADLLVNVKTTTSTLINNINSNSAYANTWAYNITLKNNPGTDTSTPEQSTLYYTGDVSTGYSWFIPCDGTQLLITDESDIQIFYSQETINNVSNWGTIVRSEAIAGSGIRLTVPEGYTRTLKGDLVIDVVHVTNADLTITE